LIHTYPFDKEGLQFYTVGVKNRERRKEAGKVILDLSKYLATLVIVGAIFTKENVQWLSVIVGSAAALILFLLGVKTIAPDKED
jgi:hypothetical protein